MKFLSKIKRFVRKPIVAATVAAATFGVATWLVTPAPTHAADCDSNAVIRCGVSSVSDLKSAYNNDKSVRNIYNYCMSISDNDISSMSPGLDANGTGVVEGSVNIDGNVFVSGQSGPVATGAITGGRQPISGSNKVDCNGTTFYKRPPSVSFQQNSLPALVDMKNGVFQFAVINSCGNPVVATAKKPGYKITKLVSVKGQGDFENNVKVDSGDHVEYKIIVESNGDVAAKNITVTDDLPKDMKEVSGSMQRIDRNNNSIPASDTNLFNGGATIDSLPVGDTVTFKFEAIAGNTSTPSNAQCVEEHLVNTASINSPALPKESNNASVDTNCKIVTQTPVFTCDSLTASPNGSNAFSFTANATAQNGASVTGYEYSFGDGQTSRQPSTSTTNTLVHNYVPGNYTATVTVDFSVNGTAKTATSGNCQKSINITPASPVTTCDSLTASPLSRTQYSFTTQATATNATVSGYQYDFGDGQSSNQASSSTTNTVTHTYAPGDYLAKVTVSFTVGNNTRTATSLACQKPIHVAQAPAAECTGLTAVAAASNPLTYSAQANYTASNGATLSSASLDWGDGTVDQSSKGGPGVAEWNPHTYAQAGTYNLTATLNFTSSSASVPASTCKTQVTINGPQVTEACNALTFTKGDNNSLTVTLTGLQTSVSPAGAATFTSADITWGDGTSNNGVANVNGLSHKYTTAGNYNIAAVAHFNVNGVDVKQGGNGGCMVPVSFTATPPPTQLVNTGVGSVFGLFAGASFLGSLIYRYFLGRRLNEEL